MYKKSNHCRLCGNKKIKHAFELGNLPLGEKYFEKKVVAKKSKFYPLTISWCKVCKNIQVREMINPKILWKNYTYLSGQTDAIKMHFEKFAKKTVSVFKLKDNDLVIDIGSNDGSLLRHFKKKGIKILGVDPAKNVVEIANRNGIKTINSLFDKKISNKIKNKFKKAKLITAFNVFAHTEKLREMLKSVYDLLEDEGIFIFEVQYLDDIYKKKILGTFFHEHMYHHSITSLNNFFEKFQMKLFKVERVNIQKGSIIGYVSKNQNINIDNSVSKFIDYEKKIKLFDYKKLKLFKKHFDNQKNKCKKIINKFSSQDIIAAYGAARSGPVLSINHGIENKIKYIFDDHALKVNKYSSFNALKVIPTKNLIKMMPKLCVILAYLHSKKIIRKNKDYLKNGGKFLILYPDVKIISKSNYKLYV